MFVKKYIHNFIILLTILFITLGCQLQEPTKTHGIVFLKNRSDTLVINKSNFNDVLKSIGEPHSKSINDENEWYYFERVLTKGEYHKLGRNLLKKNNVLVLNFDKYGVLKSKNFLDKNDKNKLAFSKNKTSNNIRQKSTVEKFLNSIKTKMYGKK